MPQQLDANPANDVPLDRPASEWLPGFAASGAFKSFQRIDLSLDATDAETPAASLNTDDGKLTGVQQSATGDLHGFWLPGTKIIGAMSFSRAGDLWQGVDAHGVGTTSSAVGNIHGTCPECLLFFIDYGDTAAQAEQAIEWAEAQPWIDVISNSYGHAGVVPKIYSGSNVDAQRIASERGQTVVFSAGNGFENAYVASNPTTFSSQKGPDWIVTVGAVTPGPDNYYGADSGSDDGSTDGASYSGAGKPVDVAGVGSDYPNAYGAAAVGGTGTSRVRRDLERGADDRRPLRARAVRGAQSPIRPEPGTERRRDGPGRPACRAARRARRCELGDGVLTAVELRTRLLHGAVHTTAGTAVYTAGGPTPTVPATSEEHLPERGPRHLLRPPGRPGQGRVAVRVRPDPRADGRPLADARATRRRVRLDGRRLVLPPAELGRMVARLLRRRRHATARAGLRVAAAQPARGDLSRRPVVMRRLVMALVAVAVLCAPAAAATDAGSRGVVAASKSKTQKKTKKKKRLTVSQKRARCLRKAKRIRSKTRRARSVRACKRRYKLKKRGTAKPPTTPPGPVVTVPPFVDGGIHDATVIAVLDFGFNPYHWDFLAAKMPQNADGEPGNDLPLDRPAADWLPGFDATQFASTRRIDLTLDGTDPDTPSDGLRSDDADKWKTVEASTLDSRNLHWFPGTKVIGAMTYLDEQSATGRQ